MTRMDAYVMPTNDTDCQGRSHDSLSGQVEFVPSLSDLHFRIGAIEIFSYGYFEHRTLVAS